MKKSFKINVFAFLLGAIIFGSIGVYATIKIQASEIEYKNGTVESALNELYTLADSTNNISNEVNTFLDSVHHNLSLNDLLTSPNIYSNSSTMENILENSTYTSLILNNNLAITALDNSNPIETTDVSKAFSSSYYNGYPASKAFTTSTNEYWSVGAGLSYENQYLGYDFGTPVWVYKMVIGMSNGKQNTDYVLEGSNDNTNYTVIKDNLHQSVDQLVVIPDNYNQKYRYYRIRMLSTVSQGGTNNTIVYYLRFYAK